MKRKILGVVSVMGLVALASCGEKKTTTKTATETTTTVTETTSAEETTTTQNPTTTTEENEYFEYNGVKATLDQIKGELKKNTNDKFYGFEFSDFENVLPNPNKLIEFPYENAVDDVSNIYDYCAFYHIDSVEIEFEESVSTQEMRHVINRSYWASKLLVSIVNFTYIIDGNKAIVDFIYNEDANTYVSKDDRKLDATPVPYTFYSEQKRNENNEVFGYQQYTNGIIDVYNSDQLVYALENKYIPNCLPSSPAEKVFTKAKSILNSIIYDDMTVLDKEIAISAWILSHASYADSEEYATYLRDSKHPDEIMSMLQGAYVEGIFDGGEGVCHGFAKTLSLLSSIEGIDNIKVSAPHDNINPNTTISSFIKVSGGRSYQSHGYVYVKDPTTNKYYICDPTYSFFTIMGNQYYYRDFAIMESRIDWSVVYQGQAPDFFYLTHEAEVSTESMGYALAFKMRVDDKEFNIAPKTEAEMDLLIENLQKYIDNYSDTNYLTGANIAVSIFPALNIADYSVDAFNQSDYSLPLNYYFYRCYFHVVVF